jgi:hypothetical protein
VSSSDVIASHLTVHSADGQFLLEVYYDAQQLKAALVRAAPVCAAAAQPTDPTFDAPDLLRKLGDLRDAGILSATEFESKKAEILKRI